MALALAGILTFESAFGSGVSVAFADNVGDDTSSIELVSAGDGSDNGIQIVGGTVSGGSQGGETESGDVTDDSGDDLRADGPWDWTNNLDQLELSADNLKIDAEKVAASIPEPQGEEEDAAEQLPEQVPATIELSLELDLTKTETDGEQPQDDSAAQEDEKVPTSVEPDDFFTVHMPEGVSLANGMEAEVFAAGENGEPGTVVVATAKAEDEGATLKVTFVNPYDTAEEEAENGDETDAVETLVAGSDADGEKDGEDEKLLLSNMNHLTASTSLDVSVPLDNFGDEGSTIEWVLQGTADEAESRKAELTLPSKSELEAMLTRTGEPETESDPTEDYEDLGNGQIAANTKPDDKWKTEGETSATLKTVWADNNNQFGNRPEQTTFTPNIVPQFTIDGMTYEFTAENASTYLHIDQSAYNELIEKMKKATDTEFAHSTWATTVSGLPQTLVQTKYEQATGEEDKPLYTTSGVPIWDVITEKTPITWSLNDKNNYGNYQRSGEITGGTQYLMLNQDSTYTIIGKTGDMLFEDLADATSNNLMIEILVNGEPLKKGGSEENLRISVGDIEKWDSSRFVQEIGASLNAKWNREANSTQGTLTINGPAFTKDNEPIEYRLVYVPTDQDKDDYIEATYNNEGVSNHGSSTDSAYSGGKITFTRRGKTDFDATKVWLDNNNTYGTRGNATFSLWRYPLGNDPSTAAQVTDPSGEFVSIELTEEMMGSDEYKDENDEGKFDLAAIIAKQYRELANEDGSLSLEKYDPNGVPYIYGIREDTLPTGYEAVFGEVGDNNTITEDKAPNYLNEEGNPVETSEDWTRGSDILTYNGGTLSNQLAGTVTVSTTKTWKVAAFADQLKPEGENDGVVCTFTLQSRPKGDEEGTWENVIGADDNPVTQDLTGFSAERLSQVVTGVFDKYDADGQELEYRWIETNVTQNGDGTGFVPNESGDGGSFTLNLKENPEDVETTEIKFFSKWEEGDDLKPPTIENFYQQATTQTVIKKWDVVEEATRADLPDEITVAVYRGYEEIGVFKLDGKADTEPLEGWNDGVKGYSNTENKELNSPTAKEVVTAEDTENWQLEITNLPMFSDDGAGYVYRVMEKNVGTGWGSTVETSGSETTITNSQGPGIGTDFHLTKEWIDDGDSSHQLEVHVKVTAAKDIKKNWGESPDEIAYTKDEVIIDDLVLNADNKWFLEFTVPGASNVQPDQLNVEETYLLDGDTEYYVVADADEAADKYSDGTTPPDWANKGWDAGNYKDNQYPRVATEDHVYEVTTTTRDPEDEEENEVYDLDMFVINNRRIGLVDISVNKTWQDEGANKTERPDAYFELYCDDNGAKFVKDEVTGDISIQLTEGNILPIFKNEESTERYNVKTDNVEIIEPNDEENSRWILRAPVPKSTDSGKKTTVGFYGLPKYTGEGKVVQYYVDEVWSNEADHGDYVIVENTDENGYEVGNKHFHDQQTFSFTNTRSGETTATFYKKWSDQYVNEVEGKRPDIYLTLYQLIDGELKPYNQSIRYVWETPPDGSDLDKGYNQRCTVSGLPKYDSDGREILYYAKENMSSDGGALDYVEVTFDDQRMENPDNKVKLYKLPEAEGETATAVENDDFDTAQGYNYALLNGGTFKNELYNAVTVQGTKIWSQLPGNVETDSLPDILLILQRRVAPSEGEDDKWPDVYIQQVDDAGSPVGWKPYTKTGGDPNGCIAWTTSEDFDGEGSTTFSYTMKQQGYNDESVSSSDYDLNENKPLEKYTENGQLYQYRLVEVMVGLIGTPGVDEEYNEEYFASTSLSNDSGLHEGNNVFKVNKGEQGVFRLDNVYDSDKGVLTVKKQFEGRAEGDSYPDVTFTLYRRYQTGTENGAPTYSKSEKVSTSTISASEFEGDSANGSATHTFDDLDIYAPNGQYWHYFVVEDQIDGYPEVKVGLGEGELQDATNSLDDSAFDGWVSPEAMNVDGTSRVTASTTTVEGATPTDDVDITFSNTYEPSDTLTLTGTKVWHDYSNLGGKGTRPSDLELTLTRSDGTDNESESVSLTDANLKWTKYDANGNALNTWTFTITGLEQWAPNGKAWVYTISEMDSKESLSQAGYRIETGVSSTSGKRAEGEEESYSGEFPGLSNGLANKVTVTKTWNDGDDEWGLRPETITVQLEAKLSNEEGDWASADSFNDGALKCCLETGSASVELNTAGNWTYDWNYLPRYIKGGSGQTSQEILYRVVEVKIGNKGVVIADDPAATDELISYNTALSYNGSQTIERKPADGNNLVLTENKITNTLESTSIQVTKNWKDLDNIWGLRETIGDGYGDQLWTVTYYLQRAEIEEGTTPPEADALTWEFVKDADGGYISRDITGPLEGGGLNEVSKPFVNLPKLSPDGNEYAYRMVEVVPGGYGVENGAAVTPGENGPEGNLNVVNVEWPTEPNDTEPVSSQTYTNSLGLLSFSGTKEWEDYGTGLIPDNTTEADNLPKLRLQWSTNGTNWSTVLNANNVTPTPMWGINTDDGENPPTWSWEYTSLPETDGDGNPYTYRVVETDSVDGFYISQNTSTGTAEKESTNGGYKNQTGTPSLRNVATRFTFDKVNDDESANEMKNVELVVKGKSDNKVYAVWYRDASGSESSYVWPDGVEQSVLWTGSNTPNNAFASTPAESGAVEMNGNNAGYIIGLPAGTYTVIESGNIDNVTSDSNTQHARIEPFDIMIAESGTVELAGTIDGVDEGADGTISCVKFTVTDPIFRAYFEFTKVLGSASGDSLAGATFELWREKDDGSGPKAWEKVAIGISTDTNGHFTSKESTIEIMESTGARDNKHTKLSDGLLRGKYKLVETDLKDEDKDLVHWGTGESRSIEFEVGEDDHGTVKEIGTDGNIVNPAFNAKVKLTKIDATDSAPISDAKFKLEWSKGGDDSWTVVDDYETGTDGILIITLNKKGHYRLTETENKGYEIDEEKPPTITFELEDEDHQAAGAAAYELNTTDQLNVVAENFATTSYESGFANTRLPGEVTMNKVDAEKDDEGINGATFKLVVEESDGNWVDFAKGLETGYDYSYDADSGAIGEGEKNSVPGQIKITNLPWGTYQFVETAAAPGYELNVGDSPITSHEFVIGRDADAENTNPVEGTVDTDSISVSLSIENNKTGLTIRKLNTSGTALAGATFEIVPAEGSSFAGPERNKIEVVTGEGGSIEIEEGVLVVGNTYTIRETAAPEGYELIPGSFSFTVKDDGAISATNDSTEASEGAVGYRISTEGGVVTLIATDKPIDVTLIKKGKSTLLGEPVTLEGVQFKVTPLEGSKFVDGTETGDDGSVLKTTDNDGEIDLTGLLVQGNVYAIEEVAAPDGYELLKGRLGLKVEEDGTLEVGSIDDDGKFTEGNAPDGYEYADNTVTITATDTMVEARLKKVSADNDGALSGATFTITPDEDSAFVDGYTPPEGSGITVNEDGSITVTTDESGLTPLLVGVLKVGNSYVITETVAPDGYELAGIVTVTVNENGTLAVDESVTCGSGLYEAEADEAGIAILVAKDEPIEITLKKVSTRNVNTTLAGAEFTITPAVDSSFVDNVELNSGMTVTRDENGITSITVTTGTDGLAHVVGMLKQNNTYVVTETKAPNGYELNTGKLTFTVNADGTIARPQPTTGTTDPDGGATTGSDGAAEQADDSVPAVGIPNVIQILNDEVTIVATDEPIEMQIGKTAADGSTPLSGVVFEISGEFASDDGGKIRLTTDENGAVALPSAELIAGNTYTVTEVSSAPGYEVCSSFQFKVGTDGSIDLVSPTEETNSLVTVTDNAIVLLGIRNNKIELNLKKVDQSGNPLTGAEFKIEGKFADDGTEKAFTIENTETGTVALDGLVGGNTYTITEVRAPSGYYTLPEFEFTVNRDGTISAKATSAGDDTWRSPGYYVSEDRLTLIAVDQLIPPDPVPGPSEPGAPGVDKSLSGRDMLPGEFSFVISADESYGSAVTPSSITGTNDASGNVSFGDGFTFRDEGDYHFTISEVLPADDDPETEGVQHNGVTYDGSSFSAVAHVTRVGGRLSVSWELPGGAAFHNEYEPSETAQIVIGATKVLEGRDLAAGEFFFELRDEAGNVVGTATNAADGTVAFPPLEFTEAGTYTYTMTEVSGGADGVTYDGSTHTVTVTVVDNGDGTLTATVSYDGSGAAPTFTNTYAPEEPAEPDGPVEPVEPGTPVTPERPEVPDTGDRTNAAIPVVIGVVGAVLIFGALYLRRRRRR